MVQHQVARDGDQPGFELEAAVVLRASLQHAQPRLLEDVLGQLAVSAEMKQVAKKAMLVLEDQSVQQLGIAPPQPARDLRPLGFHPCPRKLEFAGHPAMNTHYLRRKSPARRRRNKLARRCKCWEGGP